MGERAAIAEAIRAAAVEDGAPRPPSPAALSAARSAARFRDDAAADRSAGLLGAQAVAFGDQILFRRGAYDPASGRGRALIAHEVAHVAHQRRTGVRRVRRVVGGDVLSVQYTRSMAEAMTDAELAQQMQILRTRLQTAPADAGARENLATLESVASARQAPPTTGQARLSVVVSNGVEFLVSVAAGVAPASGQIDVDSARRRLAANNVAVVSGDQLNQAADYLAANAANPRTDDPSSTVAASAMPTGSTVQWLAGRFYPFARQLTATELAQVRSQRIVHLTAPASVEGIQATGLQPSRGFFLNMTDPQLRNNVWTFIGEPSSGQVGLNLAGRGGRTAHAAVVIEGANLPPGALFRPVDGALMLPGTYTGERVYFAPGEVVPPPPQTLRGPVAPADAVPQTLRGALDQAGSFSGHPAAAGGASAVIAIALDTGIYVLTRHELPPPERVTRTGVSAAVGGVAGAVTEQATARALAMAMGQAGGRLLVVGGRGIAGGVGGAVAGPIVETLQLALDDRTHTGSEYAAAAARGVVAGAASGLLGAAVTGALAGSVAPGVGTAIGFVVGVGTYMLVNWLFS